MQGHQSEIAAYSRDFNSEKAIHLRLKDYYEKAGDNRNLAVALNRLGLIAQEQRQFNEAERWYLQSLSIRERIGDTHGQAASLYQPGCNRAEHGDWSEALGFFERAEALVINMNDSYHLEMVRGAIKQAREQLGDE